MNRGEYVVYDGDFDPAFRRRLLAQFLAAENLAGVRKTHYFNGRYENIYLDESQVPLLGPLRVAARHHAERILAGSVRKMGCWFNAMGPGSQTTLHSHDDDDERLSGVYYVQVPSHSGELIIHRGEQVIRHPPREGQWVFFSPRTPHAVSRNRSPQLRLSIAFNFS